MAEETSPALPKKKKRMVTSGLLSIGGMLNTVPSLKLT